MTTRSSGLTDASGTICASSAAVQQSVKERSKNIFVRKIVAVKQMAAVRRDGGENLIVQLAVFLVNDQLAAFLHPRGVGIDPLEAAEHAAVIHLVAIDDRHGVRKRRGVVERLRENRAPAGRLAVYIVL